MEMTAKGLCQCARGVTTPDACIDRLRNTGKHRVVAPAPRIEVEATARPWSVNTSGVFDNGHGFIVWGVDGVGMGSVCRTFREGLIPSETEAARCEANAALIVKAVNSHAQLVDALRGLVAADNCNYGRDAMRSEGLFDAARAALQAVEDGQG